MPMRIVSSAVPPAIDVRCVLDEKTSPAARDEIRHLAIGFWNGAMAYARTRNAEGLGSAAIAVVFLLGTALAGLLALNLRRQQDVEIALETLERAQSLGRLAEAEIDRLYFDLQRRAAFWAELPDPDLIETRLQVFIEENPSVTAIAYPSDLGRKAATPESEAILEAWQATNPPFNSVLGPVKLSDDRNVLGANLRGSYAATDAIVIFAVYEPMQLLNGLFGEVSRDYAYGVSLNGAPLWGSDPTHSPGFLDRFTSEVPIRPQVGEPWTLAVWPTPGAIPDSHVYGPLFMLTVGVLTSGLITAALHFGTLAWRRSRILDEANNALEQHVSETRRNQQAQQQLSDELEARVAERTAELNETIAELQTFNYSVSHDLRSPLGAIINFAGIFVEDYAGRLDAVQIGYLERISASARAAVDLMDALMSYSHSGRTELRPVKLDVRRLVGEVADETIAGLPECACSVKIGDLPDTHADDAMLRFIFGNLISNACKFVKPGEVPSVEIGGQSETNENVYFVRDQGIGFDPRFEQKLFKAFERLHHPSEYPGHGIGLAIVARMVRRHGGRVWAQGAVGRGATFYFSIPKRRADGNDTTIEPAAT